MKLMGMGSGSGATKLERWRTAFSAGKVSCDKVLSALEAMVSWRNPGWHFRRRKLKAKCCDLCQSKRKLRVVDVWHPADRQSLMEQISHPLREAYQREHPLVLPDLPPFDPAAVPPPQAEMRECCPWCGSVDIEFKGSPATWTCKGSRRGRKCGHMFAQPSRRPYVRYSHQELIAQARRARDESLAAPAREWEAGFQEQYRPEIEQHLVQAALNEWQRYLEVRPEDVKTLCERCHFKRRMTERGSKAEKPVTSTQRRSLRGVVTGWVKSGRKIWAGGFKRLSLLTRFLPWRNKAKD